MFEMSQSRWLMKRCFRSCQAAKTTYMCFRPPHICGSVWSVQGFPSSRTYTRTQQSGQAASHKALTRTRIAVAKINLYVVSFAFVTPKLRGWVCAVARSLPAASPAGHGAGAPAAPRCPLPVHWGERHNVGHLVSDVQSNTVTQRYIGVKPTAGCYWLSL